MELVVVDLHIDGGMQFNTCDLVAEVLVLHGDIVDLVVVDVGLDTAHVTDHSVLTALMDHTVINLMRAHHLGAPTTLEALKYILKLLLIARLALKADSFVVTSADLFAQRDGRGLCIVQMAVFDVPALRPVGIDHATLYTSWWSPLGSGMAALKATDGDVVSVNLRWSKTALTDIDFDGVTCKLILCEVTKVSIDGGSTGLMVNLSKPLIDSTLAVRDHFLGINPWGARASATLLWILDLIQRGGLV